MIEQLDLFPEIVNRKKDPVEIQLSTEEKIKQAVRFIRSLGAMHNLALAYSSGKDSTVLYYIAKEAGIRFTPFHNVTTIDPPFTIRFAEKHGCIIKRPELSFLDLVERKGFPTQFRRFCCKKLKERYFADYVLFGIRKGESKKRNKCYSEMDDIYYYSKKVFTNRFFPLLNFDNNDVENCIKEHDLECHPLYYDAEGNFHVERRLGCIGCPLQGDRGKREYQQYPILLKQILRRGILFHKRMGRTENDAVLNLVYNLFYSNSNCKNYCQTFQGLFNINPWTMIQKHFKITQDEVLQHLPKPKFG